VAWAEVICEASRAVIAPPRAPGGRRRRCPGHSTYLAAPDDLLAAKASGLADAELQLITDHARRERLDRLGRTAKGLLMLLEELQALGAGLVSLREGFDLATPSGRLMAGVLASVAAYETGP
jgi:hypothetical protein